MAIDSVDLEIFLSDQAFKRFQAFGAGVRTDSDAIYVELETAVVFLLQGFERYDKSQTQQDALEVIASELQRLFQDLHRPAKTDRDQQKRIKHSGTT